MNFKSLLILFVAITLLGFGTYGQNKSKFNIEKDEKDRYSLVLIESGEIIYNKCKLIEQVNYLPTRTDSTILDLFVIHKSNKFIIYNSAKNDTVLFGSTKSLKAIEPMSNHSSNRHEIGTSEPIISIVVKTGKYEDDEVNVLYNLRTGKTIKLLLEGKTSSYTTNGTLIEITKRFFGETYVSIIDFHGNTIVPMVSEVKCKEMEGGFAVEDSTGKWGLLDLKTGSEILPLEFHSIRSDLKIKKYFDGTLKTGKLVDNKIVWID